jgi:hypothetical protein
MALAGFIGQEWLPDGSETKSKKCRRNVLNLSVCIGLRSAPALSMTGLGHLPVNNMRIEAYRGARDTTDLYSNKQKKGCFRIILIYS